MNKLRWLYRQLSFVNNLLLIPMFTVMVLETSVTRTGLAKQLDLDGANLGFCIFFLAEWGLGLVVAEDRRSFLRSPPNLLDLVSSIPFGYLFQGLRVVRIMRILRILRLVWRARRFRGKGAKLVRLVGVVGSTIFAGALALRIVEPDTAPEFSDGLWWSLVTLSTVGYGDIVPQTTFGKGLASILIMLGIGVFGYAAGFMSSVLEDPEEDEILARVQKIEARLETLIDRVAPDSD